MATLFRVIFQDGMTRVDSGLFVSILCRFRAGTETDKKYDKLEAGLYRHRTAQVGTKHGTGRLGMAWDGTRTVLKPIMMAWAGTKYFRPE